MHRMTWKKMVCALFCIMLTTAVTPVWAEEEQTLAMEELVKSCVDAVIEDPISASMTVTAAWGEGTVSNAVLLAYAEAALSARYGAGLVEAAYPATVNEEQSIVDYWTVEEAGLLYLLSLEETDEEVTITLKKEELASYEGVNWDYAKVPFDLQNGSTETTLKEALGTLPYSRIMLDEGTQSESVCYTVPVIGTKEYAYVQLWAKSLWYLQSMVDDQVESFSIPYDRKLFCVNYLLLEDAFGIEGGEEVHSAENIAASLAPILEGLGSEYGEFQRIDNGTHLQWKSVLQYSASDLAVSQSQYFMTSSMAASFEELASICLSYDPAVEDSLRVTYDTEKLNELCLINEWTIAETWASSLNTYVTPFMVQGVAWGMSEEELTMILGTPDAVEEEDGIRILTYQELVSCDFGTVHGASFLIGENTLQVPDGTFYQPGLYSMELTVDSGYEETVQKVSSLYKGIKQRTTANFVSEEPDVYMELYTSPAWLLGSLPEQEQEALTALVELNADPEYILTPQDTLLSIMIGGSADREKPTQLRLDATYLIQLEHAVSE